MKLSNSRGKASDAGSTVLSICYQHKIGKIDVVASILNPLNTFNTRALQIGQVGSLSTHSLMHSSQNVWLHSNWTGFLHSS